MVIPLNFNTGKVFSTLDEGTYLKHLYERDEKAAGSNTSTLVIPEVYSRIKPVPLLTEPKLDFSTFCNMNYIMLIDVMLSEGHYDLVSYLSRKLHKFNSERYCLSLIENMVSALVTSSITLRPVHIHGFVAPKINSWELLATALFGFLKHLSAIGFQFSETIFEVIIRKFCCNDNPLPFSPGLASYTGVEDLPPVDPASPALIDVDIVLEMLGKEKTNTSSILQKAILRAYLSYSLTNSSDKRGFEYFRSLEAIYSTNRRSVDPEMKAMLNQALTDIKKGRKDDNKTDDAKFSLQSRLLPVQGKPRIGFQEEKATSNLYGKVLETLLRAHRSQDAKDLLQLMQAKNISTSREEVCILMAHELKANNSIGAIEIFSAFFRMLPSTAPDVRSINLLAIALTRSKRFSDGALLAKEISPLIIRNQMNLSAPVCEAFFSICLRVNDYLTASDYLMLVPPMQRKVSSLSSLAKAFAKNGRIDLFYNYRSENPFPFEVICHLVVGYAIKGLPKKAFKVEHVLRKAAKIRNLLIPPWVRTFLLYAAAIESSWDDALRLINEPYLRPSELDYNLAFCAGLKNLLILRRSEGNGTATSKIISEIGPLITAVQLSSHRLHSIILKLAEIAYISELKGIPPCTNPSAFVAEYDIFINSTKAEFVAPYSSVEIENLQLLSPRIIDFDA